MPRFTLTFILNGQPVKGNLVLVEAAHEPHSKHFVCPTCGQEWAEVIADDHYHDWEVRTCVNCHPPANAIYGHQYPGTFCDVTWRRSHLAIMHWGLALDLWPREWLLFHFLNRTTNMGATPDGPPHSQHVEAPDHGPDPSGTRDLHGCDSGNPQQLCGDSPRSHDLSPHPSP